MQLTIAAVPERYDLEMAALQTPPARAKHNARVKTMQALYQWDLNGTAIVDLERQFLETQDMSRVDIPYFSELLHAIPKQVDRLDSKIAEYLDRPIADIDPIERAICRVGAYELTDRLDLPVRVVINEAIEIAKKFGADESHRFINGVMDKLARSARTLEFRSEPNNDQISS